jgi:hypothetical protein
VTDDEALEAKESPTVLVAIAVNVYATPFVSVEMSQDNGLTPAATVQVKFPGEDVIV